MLDLYEETRIVARDDVSLPSPQPGRQKERKIPRLYEFSARLDGNCLKTVEDQIRKSRQLHNEIINYIRHTLLQARAHETRLAGMDAQICQSGIEALEDELRKARKSADSHGIECISARLREKRSELEGYLTAVRQTHHAKLHERYYARLSVNNGSPIFTICKRAVKMGLGLGTASAVMQSAFNAYTKAGTRGRLPFRATEGRRIDILSLQFPDAGVSSADILSGSNRRVALLPVNGCGQNKYGEFRFSCGLTSREYFVTGNWQYHRILPDGVRFSSVHLMRRLDGVRIKWFIQLKVKGDPRQEAHNEIDAGGEM